MKAEPKQLDLKSTFVVIEPDQSALPVDVTPTLYEELNARFDGFSGRLLVSSFSFDSDWSSWEMHPAGDEIVCLLSGEAEMILEHSGARDSMSLREPGSYVIVPKGTWHRAKTKVATNMLFVTPGQGTNHRPL
jgi:mannose-6-phosphate isomerase-like protein (cupin superfamily)